jgi:hypothetical protein
MFKGFCQNFYIRFFLATILVILIGLTLHIYLLKMLNPMIIQWVSSAKIAQPPYNFFITSAAYITAIFPAMGQVIICYIIAQYIPFNKLLKGLIFAFLMLLANGEIIRMPLMDFLVGNPWKVVALQHLQTYVVQIIIGIVIIFILPQRKIDHGSRRNI